MSDNFKERTKNKLAINARNWSTFAFLLQLFGKLAKYTGIPVLGALLKRIAFFDRPEKNFTQGYTLNLNQDLTSRGSYQNTVLPISLIQKAIKESTYRAIMTRCICRDGKKCEHYPVDFGCIFIGEGSRVVEERGVARSVTVEQALEHVQTAAEKGLIGQCLWIEAEKFVWGIEEKNLHQFLEICFCCPCCCVALQNFGKASRDVQERFRTIGWKASSLAGCNGCGECETVCPMRAITVSEDHISVSELCLGCGTCAATCPNKAIQLDPISPIKGDIKEYFWGFTPEV